MRYSSVLPCNATMRVYILLHVHWALAGIISRPNPATTENTISEISDPRVSWSPQCINTSIYPALAGDMDYDSCAYAFGESCHSYLTIPEDI